MTGTAFDLGEIGDVIATYSGGPTLAGTPAGSRAEGSEFEQAVASAWALFAKEAATVARIYSIRPARKGQSRAIKLQSRQGPWALYLGPSRELLGLAEAEIQEEVPAEWLQRKFLVSQILADALGPGPYPFAPATELDSRLYHGPAYSSLFTGKSTNFDFAGALVSEGVLKEKLLFEYKYAKSTRGKAIDGNAHERLGFQVLQYVEIATRYPACSLNIIAAQAFSEYQNKYHPSFNQQAIRLNGTFQQVQMRYAACRSEYIALFQALGLFLSEGELPPDDYRALIR